MPSTTIVQCPQTPRKRRRGDSPELPAARRRRLLPPADEAPDENSLKRDENVKTPDVNAKKPVARLFYSPSDVADLAVVQLRDQQAHKSKLPDLSTPVNKNVKTGQTAVKTAKPPTLDEILGRRSARRPPLCKRAFVRNRARFGVGIVRCWSSAANISGWDGEETETDESDSPPSSPRGETSLELKTGARRVPIDPKACGCEDAESVVDTTKLEDSAVLPIDPSQACFDDSYSADQWQLRSPSPDPLFVPIPSSPGKTTTEQAVEETKNQSEVAVENDE